MNYWTHTAAYCIFLHAKPGASSMGVCTALHLPSCTENTRFSLLLFVITYLASSPNLQWFIFVSDQFHIMPFALFLSQCVAMAGSFRLLIIYRCFPHCFVCNYWYYYFPRSCFLTWERDESRCFTNIHSSLLPCTPLPSYKDSRQARLFILTCVFCRTARSIHISPDPEDTRHKTQSYTPTFTPHKKTTSQGPTHTWNLIPSPLTSPYSLRYSQLTHDFIAYPRPEAQYPSSILTFKPVPKASQMTKLHTNTPDPQTSTLGQYSDP